MALLMVDGPEKAGKSTLVKMLQEMWPYGAVNYRHWGKIPDSHNGGPAHHIYMEPMMVDVETSLHNPQNLIIWDRGPAAEAVYSYLLHRPGRQLAKDWWLADHTFTRTIRSIGVPLMVLGPDADVLKARRTSDDHPIPPTLEQAAFAEFAWRFGWHYFYTEPMQPADSLWMGTWDTKSTGHVEALMTMLFERAFTRVVPPPIYEGPAFPQIIVMGECAPLDGGWEGTKGRAYGPFYGKYTIPFARLFRAPSTVGWTNAMTLSAIGKTLRDCDPLDDAKIIAAGKKAQQAAKAWGYKADRILGVPHPAFLYRWGSMKDKIPYVESTIREFIGADAAEAVEVAA